MKLFSFFQVIVLSGFLATGVFGAVEITGAGASFPYPLYTKWFAEYQKANPNVTFNYQSIGSGGGIKQFTEGTVDFGATDAKMTDDQKAKLKEKRKLEALHVPTALGAVVVTYNLPGVEKGLKLTPQLIGDIFLGKIKKWDHPEIKKLNPKLTSTKDIVVVYRADGSGTTNIFTEYLSKAHPEWKTAVGEGTSVEWKVGIGGKGNDGVAGAVKGAEGSIGYVELIYAESNKLPYAAVQNSKKQFVLPSIASVTAAAEGVVGSMPKVPTDFATSLTNIDSAKAYPISGFTYLLLGKPYAGGEKDENLLKFIRWALKDGQKLSAALFYSPLPKPLITRVEAALDQLQGNKTKVN